VVINRSSVTINEVSNLLKRKEADAQWQDDMQ
jgi:hypothetical protein